MHGLGDRNGTEFCVQAGGYRASILEKPHLAQFLTEALRESGLATAAFENGAALLAALPEQRPQLIVLGTLRHGIDSVRVIEELARIGYDGSILVIGPTAAPLTKAIHTLACDLGLRVLPVLATPFSQDTLRTAVLGIQPASLPPPPSITLRDALRWKWLDLWYQPKLEMRSFTLQGAEALLRIRHPVLGILGPERLLDDASADSLLDLSAFVVSRAVADWRWFCDQHGHVDLAINLPLAYLSDPNRLADLVSRIPADQAFDGLIVETNACELIGALDTVRMASTALAPLKVALSVDDLGAEWPQLIGAAGYDFLFTEIKVDRTLVSGCPDDSKKRAACHRIVQFADSVGARTVAEGVETRAEFVTVRDLGFDAVQGFFVARPMPRSKFLSRVLRKPLTLAGMADA